jgi:hypothetical protein
MNRRNGFDDPFSALFRSAGAGEDMDGYERMPGLHRSWELEQVLLPGASYVVQDAGKTADGTPLFTIYRGSSEKKEPR